MKSLKFLVTREVFDLVEELGYSTEDFEIYEGEEMSEEDWGLFERKGV